MRQYCLGCISPHRLQSRAICIPTAAPGGCEDRPSRLLVDCPRCENRGALALDDDRTITRPLCNNWCLLCLDGGTTFVPITRAYRGNLIAGMRPTAGAYVQPHVDACAGCVRYHRQHQTIDMVLRAELPSEAPQTLTARLLAGASARTTCGAPSTNEGPMIGSLRERCKREQQADILRVAWRLIGEKG